MPWLKIDTGSDLMLGSGTGQGSEIDNDIVIDENGLPIVPAKRLKGLLLESAMEVKEWLHQSGLEEFSSLQIDEVFGSAVLPPQIDFRTLKPIDYQNTVDWLNYARQEYPQLYNRESVLNAITDIREHTAIDKNGCAQANSLRKIRVLCHPYSFEGNITILKPEWRNEIEILLALACLNLKRAGSGRNRGWGKISCRLYSDDGLNINEKVIADLKSWYSDPKPTNTHRIDYLITVTSPLIFTAPDGDENMVKSLDYIPGMALHGYYANQLIKARNMESSKAHQDRVFCNWFLNGDIVFTNAYLFDKDTDHPLYPTPLYIQTNKRKSEPFNLMDREIRDDTQTIGGYCTIIEDGFLRREPAMVSNLHLVRNSNPEMARERIEGHGDDGGIYNYEGLEENQVFHGSILGREQDLADFMTLFKDYSRQLKLGRSLNTQYGSAKIDFQPIVENNPSIDDSLWGDAKTDSLPNNQQIILYLCSPLILRNQWGFSNVNGNDLVGHLRDCLTVDVEIKKSFARVESRNAFVSHWKIYEPAWFCWAAGTAFLLEFDRDIDQELERNLNRLMRAGIGEKRGQGYGRVVFTRNTPIPDNFYLSNVISDYSKPEKESSTALSILDDVKNDYLNRIVSATAAKRAREFYQANGLEYLSNSLLGRLERIIDNSNDRKDLAVKLDLLRETARKQLENSQLRGKKLIEDLYDTDLKKWCEAAVENEWDLVARASEELNLQQNIEHLFKLYWRVFLRVTRKLNKETKVKQRGGGMNAVSE